MDGNTMAFVWGGLLLLFVVIEALTVQLVSIWFAAGALSAVVAVLCGANKTVQIVVFLGVTVVALVVTRPIVKKFINSKVQSTNADRNIGKIAVVTEDIDNVLGKGRATVGGLEWTARTIDGSSVSSGEKVVVEKIEGVKLMVHKRD